MDVSPHPMMANPETDMFSTARPICSREDHRIDQPELIGDPCAGQGGEAADDHGSEQDATQLVISQAIGGLK